MVKVKGRCFIVACLVVMIAAFFCVETKVRAEDQLEIEKTELCYATCVQEILQDDRPLLALNRIIEEKGDTLIKLLSAEEKAELLAIYRYCVLTDVAETGMESNMTNDILDTGLEFYLQLIRNGPENHIDVTKIEKRAFDTYVAEMVKKDETWNVKIEGVSGYESYVAYLQENSELDIKGIASKFDAVKTAESEGEVAVFEELRAQLFVIYGLVYEESKDSKEEAIQDPAEIQPESETNSELQTQKKARSASAIGLWAVARIGGTYYSSFDEAIYSMSDGSTIYVLQDCVASHLQTTKSFSLYPEGRDVKITFQTDQDGAAGMICTPEEWYGDPTWTLGGNNGFTLTLDANGKGGSGVLAAYGATINLHAGVRLANARGNGVWNDSGITNVYEDAKIYNNGSHGIATFNTVNMYGGEIYGNGYDGIRAGKAINLSGGSLHDNGECGIHPGDGACTLFMTGGSSYRNTYGVGNYGNKSSLYIQGGDIYENLQYGVMFTGQMLKVSKDASIRNNHGSGISMQGGTTYIEGGKICYNTSANVGGGIRVAAGRLHITGGLISGNVANQGGGVYFGGSEFVMSGMGAVDQNNTVHLARNTFITVPQPLQSPIAANLTFDDYWLGREAVKVLYGEQKGSLQQGKFSMVPNGSFCLRPGDYQSKEAQTGKEEIVLSTYYPVSYIKNIACDVKSLPDKTAKYWFEGLNISTEIPSAGVIRFRGWSENADAQSAQYQPGQTIPATLNKNIVFYALWGPKLRVTYCGNGNDKGTERSEIILPQNCVTNQGYMLQKNVSFTKFEKQGYKLRGWDLKKDAYPNGIRFSEEQNHKVSFQELLKLVTEQIGEPIPDRIDMVELHLYAVWDKEPEITATGVQEFYEGTEVTGEMLLQNIRGIDKEDGDITERIHIIGIEYGAGKWDGNQKQSQYREDKKGESLENIRLDTWFEQLQKDDSPITHQVIYQVTDSAGNQVTESHPVKVKYNEYPKIEAPDRYFTLEEAQNGVITEALLLDNALAEGKLKVWDQEDDEILPGEMQKRIRLIGYKEDEFKAFDKSGFVTVTYTAQDSMGPMGDGKETFHQCIVHIVKDGEIKKPDPVTYVRFVNKKYFDKELGAGLLPDSKWYCKPEYNSILTKTLSEEKESVEKWKFGKEDVKNVKSYVEEHGIGNSKNGTALNGFIEQFGELIR